MLKWFRRGPSPHQTALAMVGPKSGDRVLLAGNVGPEIAAEIARVTGLNGQTTVANLGSAKASFEAAAAEAGSLLDFSDNASSHFSTGDESLDIVVLASANAISDPAFATMLPEAFRALRRGGRLVLMNGDRKTGLFSRGSETPIADEPVQAAILASGGRAVRLLGVAEGIHYYEAQKPRG